MRLFLLPISTRQSLIYCQKRSHLPGQSSYIDRVTSKASERWLLWEKNESGWQKKVTEYGNKLFQRLSYQEWGLKSVPPLSERRKAEELEGKTKSTVEYPGSLVDEAQVREVLRGYASEEKQAYHRKWMWASVAGMPVSAPIALLPVIPNLPFFYLVFRWWSHWRAGNGSKHIQFLLDNNLLDLAPSLNLDTAYAVGKTKSIVKEADKTLAGIQDPKLYPLKSAVDTDVSSERLLLSKRDGALVADTLDTPELGPEIERAVWQVKRSTKAQVELQNEKDHLGSTKNRQEKG